MKKFPSLKQLHYLVTLSETLHFGEAAKRCFVSQSTLSSGIQNLEMLMGCTLLERDNKAFFFTDIGKNVIEQARELLASSQDLMGVADVANKAMEGTLRVGCIPTIAPFLLGNLVQSVNHHYPNLQLFLREETTSQLLKGLKHGDLDVLILALPTELNGMESLIVGRDPFNIVLSEPLANAIPSPFSYAHLPENTLLFLEKAHCLTQHSLMHCHDLAESKIHPFSATSLHTLVDMIANGFGGAILPQLAIDHGLLKGKSVRIFPPPTADSGRDIALVWRPTSHHIARFKTLGQLVACLLPRSALR